MIAIDRGAWRRSCRSSGRSTRRSGVARTAERRVQRLVDLRRRRPAPAPWSRSGRRCLPSSAFCSVWIFASARPSGASASRTWSTVAGLLQRRGDPRAAVEVDAEVDALAGHRQRADEQDAAGQGEEPLRLAHVVEPELVASARRRRAPPWSASSARAAQRVQDRLRGEHRREQRDDDAEAEREGEALDARGGDDEEDERDQERDDVRVDDRRQALAVARGDRRGDRSARRAPPP